VEEKIVFTSEGFALQGLYGAGTGGRGVVITHPHPLYGGTMENPVVVTLARAYQACGFATLRFNFRGVGASQGKYDEGRGETRDVAAAAAWLVDAGATHVDLAGYSFGAWVNAKLKCRRWPLRMVMVAPPVALIDFSTDAALPCLELVVGGSADAFAPADALRRWVLRWQPAAHLEIIAGADHFFTGHLSLLQAALSRHL
jgi:alpha/beta superfamily hydrolase